MCILGFMGVDIENLLNEVVLLVVREFRIVILM